jgi:transposase
VIDLLLKEQGIGTRVSTRAGNPGPLGARIWIAAGATDMRRGFQGLAAQVQTALEQQPYSGHIFIFRGRRGDMVKLLWFDGDGLCLFQKRLERGRFVWPQATSGTVSLSRAQMSMLLEGIDWRAPLRTAERVMSV